MPRLLHTADWQLGIKLRYLPDEQAAQLRGERVDVVRDIAALARQHAVDAVIVAGDVFDDNGVDELTVQAARDALEAFAPTPVLLLPGNHDAAVAGGVLGRLNAGPHVHVLLDRAPRQIGDVWFHPCPLAQRHGRGDPAAHVAPRAGALNVAIAHGTVLDFDDRRGSPNLIDLSALLASGVDYAALGDWHGTRQVHARAWYPGTPEPTRFVEKDHGNVLLVDLAPGETPNVRSLAVGRNRWLEQSWRCEATQDVDRLVAWLEGLTQKSRTLVRLSLAGQISLDDRATLDAALETASQTLRYLDVVDEALRAAPSAVDLRLLDAEGFVGDAVRALQESGDPAAEEALRLLYRWVQELRCA